MPRAAAHYIWCYGHCYRLHYIEWDANGYLITLAPLEEELAGVTFYNGTIAVIPADAYLVFPMSADAWQRLSAEVQPGVTRIKVCEVP